jgi:hypothetical protein
MYNLRSTGPIKKKYDCMNARNTQVENNYTTNRHKITQREVSMGADSTSAAAAPPQHQLVLLLLIILLLLLSSPPQQKLLLLLLLLLVVVVVVPPIVHVALNINFSFRT